MSGPVEAHTRIDVASKGADGPGGRGQGEPRPEPLRASFGEGLRAIDLACQMGSRRLFAGLNFALDPGQWLALTGDNGSGKSTLLRILAGLIRPHEGHITWQGGKVSAGDAGWHAQMLYQGHASGWKDTLTARENVRWQAALDLAPLSPSQREAGVDEALQRAGLARQRDLPFARLSAGQRRRVALARLLLAERPLWLLDEPNTALDAEGQALLADCLQAHLEAGGCAVVATHLPLALRAPPIALRLQAPTAAR